MFETDSTTNSTTICGKTDIYAQKTGARRIPKGSRGITNSTRRRPPDSCDMDSESSQIKPSSQNQKWRSSRGFRPHWLSQDPLLTWVLAP